MLLKYQQITLRALKFYQAITKKTSPPGGLLVLVNKKIFYFNMSLS